MAHPLVILTSWAAVAAGTASAGVQFRRVTAQGVEAVSLATWLMFTLIGGFWIAFGALSAHSWVVISGSVLCWPLQASIVARLQPWRHWRELSQATGLFAVTCILPGVVGGWSWCVYGCGVAMTLMRVPQFMELVRTHDARGVSAASWFIGAGCATLWIIYYWNIHLWAPLIATACSGSASVVIALMALLRHRQNHHDFVRSEVFAS